MAYKTREMLISEIDGLNKRIEAMEKDHVAHMDHIEKKSAEDKEDLNTIIDRLAGDLADIDSELTTTTALLKENREFVSSCHKTFRVYAENSSPTIVTESDILEDSDIPRS